MLQSSDFTIYCAIRAVDATLCINLFKIFCIRSFLFVRNFCRLLCNTFDGFYIRLGVLEYLFVKHDSILPVIQLYNKLWFDGLMIDFLQKLSFNRWVQSFIIGTIMLFNDKFLFEKPSRFLLNNLAKPLQTRFFFDGSDVYLTVASILYFVGLAFLVIQALFVICTLILNGFAAFGVLGKIINLLHIWNI